jgi:hypothetical protein
MKSIRKIAGKVTALAMAIATSVALLSPYDVSAQSGGGTGGGGGTKCFVKNSYFEECGYTVSMNGNITIIYVQSNTCTKVSILQGQESSCAAWSCNPNRAGQLMQVSSTQYCL